MLHQHGVPLLTRSDPALFFLPALLLAFLRRGDGEALVHVAVEQPQNVTACQKACSRKSTVSRLMTLKDFQDLMNFRDAAS